VYVIDRKLNTASVNRYISRMNAAQLAPQYSAIGA
jgi:hypothetical protein